MGQYQGTVPSCPIHLAQQRSQLWHVCTSDSHRNIYCQAVFCKNRYLKLILASRWEVIHAYLLSSTSLSAPASALKAPMTSNVIWFPSAFTEIYTAKGWRVWIPGLGSFWFCQLLWMRQEAGKTTFAKAKWSLWTQKTEHCQFCLNGLSYMNKPDNVFRQAKTICKKLLHQFTAWTNYKQAFSVSDKVELKPKN